MDFLYGTWHWAISGFLIGAIMLLLIYFGKSFGMSSNLRTMCSMAGANRHCSFFDLDWKEQKWSLPASFNSRQNLHFWYPIIKK